MEKKLVLVKNVRDVRNDFRLRLTITTKEKVLVEFNGPILQFSIDNPAEKEPIKSLGPDCLDEIFDLDEAKKRLQTKPQLLISEALLDQKIISGIGNKYKSEILFICKIWPFKQISKLDPTEEKILFEGIPKILKFGYKNFGRTRHLLENEKNFGILDIGCSEDQGNYVGHANQRLIGKDSNYSFNILVSKLSTIVFNYIYINFPFIFTSRKDINRGGKNFYKKFF